MISDVTQHRQYGRAVLRFGPGLPPIIKLVSPKASRLDSPSWLARQT